MKTDHLKLYLSGGRPSDAIEAIQDKIIEQSIKDLESIKDPEELLAERKALRSKKEALQANIKRIKATNTKINKQREKMLSQWSMFLTGVIELSRKHGIDFEAVPNTATGRTFITKLQNSRPETFVQVEKMRIPQIRTDALLDDEKVKLFEIEVKQEQLEEIISKKSKALKALFDNDLE
jgi:predicted nuclease with TOPRIM domain